MVTGSNRNAEDQLDALITFLREPAEAAGKLTDAQLEFRNELMGDYRFASLLRIYTPGVWYERFCEYLRVFVWPKWNSSSVKNSWAQTREKK